MIEAYTEATTRPNGAVEVAKHVHNPHAEFLTYRADRTAFPAMPDLPLHSQSFLLLSESALDTIPATSAATVASRRVRLGSISRAYAFPEWLFLSACVWVALLIHMPYEWLFLSRSIMSGYSCPYAV